MRLRSGGPDLLPMTKLKSGYRVLEDVGEPDDEFIHPLLPKKPTERRSWRGMVLRNRRAARFTADPESWLDMTGSNDGVVVPNHPRTAAILGPVPIKGKREKVRKVVGAIKEAGRAAISFWVPDIQKPEGYVGRGIGVSLQFAPILPGILPGGFVVFSF